MALIGKDRNSLGLKAGIPSLSAEHVLKSMAEMVIEKEARERSDRRNICCRMLPLSQAVVTMLGSSLKLQKGRKRASGGFGNQPEMELGIRNT